MWRRIPAVCSGKPFAKNFRETIGRLFRRLFRVYAHLYSNHFDHICALGIEGEYRVVLCFGGRGGRVRSSALRSGC